MDQRYILKLFKGEKNPDITRRIIDDEKENDRLN